jgi:hypothetical protein
LYRTKGHEANDKGNPRKDPLAKGEEPQRKEPRKILKTQRNLKSRSSRLAST